MKPHVKLAGATLPDGTRFSLHRHDGKFYLRYNGEELMSTALTYSEQLLAEIGCRALTRTTITARPTRASPSAASAWGSP